MTTSAESARRHQRIRIARLVGIDILGPQSRKILSQDRIERDPRAEVRPARDGDAQDPGILIQPADRQLVQRVPDDSYRPLGHSFGQRLVGRVPDDVADAIEIHQRVPIEVERVLHVQQSPYRLVEPCLGIPPLVHPIDNRIDGLSHVLRLNEHIGSSGHGALRRFDGAVLYQHTLHIHGVRDHDAL